MSDDGIEGKIALHLRRAGEMLRREELAAAEKEVALALALRADDLRARNLLGLLHFRAGRLEEALRLFLDLVARAPDDAALRLNLGLVQLRLGRNSEAVTELRAVTDREPGNLKARSYLGLALWRSGDLLRARRAFLDAGNEDLARQVEERMAAEVQTGSDLRRAKPDRPSGEEKAMTGRIDRDVLSALIEPLVGKSPAPEAAVAPLRMRPSVRLGDFTSARLLRPATPEETFTVLDDSALMLRVDGTLASRMSGAIATSGRLAYQPLMRRERGRMTSERFGEADDGLNQVTGKGTIIIHAQGARFVTLALQKQEIVYLREPALYAFDLSLYWENGHVPGAHDLWFAQLRGAGQCVLRLSGLPVCVKVVPGETLFLDGASVLGWVGRVVPIQRADGAGQPLPYLECSGEGMVLVSVS